MTQKRKGVYREIIRCQGCGERFEKKHGLRLYCDRCREKMSK